LVLLDQVFGYAALCYALLFGQEVLLSKGPHVIAPFYQHLSLGRTKQKTSSNLHL